MEIKKILSNESKGFLMSIITKKPICFMLVISVTSNISTFFDMFVFNKRRVVRRLNIAELLSISLKELLILFLDLH